MGANSTICSRPAESLTDKTVTCASSVPARGNTTVLFDSTSGTAPAEREAEAAYN